MADARLDRRRHKHFRILYLDFRTFWNRFVVRGELPQATPAIQKAPALPSKRPTTDDEARVSPSGNQMIDKQRLKIRDLILNIQKDLRNGLADQLLVKRLDLLLQHLDEHFRTEEAYLDQTGFPDLENHRAEHAQFNAQILQLRERARAEDHTVSLELSSILFNWLRNHTLQEALTFTESHHPR